MQSASHMPSSTRQGRVTLVGAGPGDPELLTLKAVRILQSADVILYDDLVSEEVLDVARREARRMLVGKRGGRPSCKQDDINDLMVKLALQGKHVVRLKSGDPMIFGRAGEELERLEAEGIPVNVVPGITSASAMAATLGVSLTHRAHAQSVRFITGHGKSGELPETLDWKGLADASTTLIVYMGGRTAQRLAQRLLEHGLESETPVVVVSAVSLPRSQTWYSTMGQVARVGIPKTMINPVLIGIGAALTRRVPHWAIEIAEQSRDMARQSLAISPSSDADALLSPGRRSCVIADAGLAAVASD